MKHRHSTQRINLNENVREAEDHSYEFPMEVTKD